MNATLSINAVLRRVFSTYVSQAPALMAAALMLVVVVKLDTALLGGATGVIAGLINLLLLALFVCFVVLAATDAWENGAHRPAGELLRGAWQASGRLLLVGVVAGLSLGLVSSFGSGLIVALLIGAAFAAGANIATILVGALVATIVLLIPMLYLMTTWSVFAPVAILECPRGLHALGRSRQLVRGNGSRVLALVLMLTLPLSVGTTALASVPHLIGAGPALAGGLLLATLIAPIPVLATTALYYELHETEPTTATLGGEAPSPA
jgi:hypothetical protein